MSTRLNIPKHRVFVVLITLTFALIIYWIVHSRWVLTNQTPVISTMYTRKDRLLYKKNSVQKETIEIIQTKFLPQPTHEQLFTKFDADVLNGLFGDDENNPDHRHITVDMKTIANARYSKIRLTSPKTHYVINDVIFVSIAVHDGNNKRLLRGGDIIRVWIKEVSNGACTNGYVVDHRNGTYTGVVQLLWAGHVQIMAAIASTREAVRVLYTIHKEEYRVRQMEAVFQRRLIYEVTACAYTPRLPYSHVCNLTDMNYGLPWYCGHPHFLTCAEWTKTGGSQPPWPLYKKDREPFDSEYSHQNLRESPSIIVNGERDTGIDDRGYLPCNELPPRVTWKQSTPVGYFLNWRWRSTVCTNTLPNTVQSWDSCLSNRRIWMHGDSTLRQWFSYFKSRQTVVLTSEEWAFETWPYPSSLYSKEYNYAIYWTSHELPYTNTGDFVLRSAHKATHVYIDELPADSPEIVIIHLYLHFSAYPPTVVRTHLRRIVQSIKSLLERAPASKVFVKGPHAFHDGNNRGVIDDYWGTIYTQIYKKEFEDIQDKVYYLDFWDMSVSAECVDVHPNVTLIEAQIQTMLGYICP